VELTTGAWLAFVVGLVGGALTLGWRHSLAAILVLSVCVGLA
jgi:hypothetical protein